EVGVERASTGSPTRLGPHEDELLGAPARTSIDGERVGDGVGLAALPRAPAAHARPGDLAPDGQMRADSLAFLGATEHLETRVTSPVAQRDESADLSPGSDPQRAPREHPRPAQLELRRPRARRESGQGASQVVDRAVGYLAEERE